jgi:DNA invertase Pin-like site-specific DNA recombinase
LQYKSKSLLNYQEALKKIRSMETLNSRINKKLQAAQNKPKKKHLSDNDRQKIINFFLTEKNNSVSRIAREFEVTKHQVSGVLDKHLSKK